MLLGSLEVFRPLGSKETVGRLAVLLAELSGFLDLTLQRKLLLDESSSLHLAVLECSIRRL